MEATENGSENYEGKRDSISCLPFSTFPYLMENDSGLEVSTLKINFRAEWTLHSTAGNTHNLLLSLHSSCGLLSTSRGLEAVILRLFPPAAHHYLLSILPDPCVISFKFLVLSVTV